jgi:uncharacterized protein
MMTLRELMVQGGPAGLAVSGLLIGLAFGAIVYRTNFCTMGSISDVMTFGDWRRFRAWILAAATALLGAQLLQAGGIVELSMSMYLSPQLNWFGHCVGGLMFGFGMVLAGGCASKNLARAGGGDLRALLTLMVVGVTAYMAIGGVFGIPRAWLEARTAIDLKPLGAATQSLGALIARPLGLTSARADLIVMTLLVLAALLYCFKDQAFRSSVVHIISGLGVGLCVVAGWVVTGLAFDELATKPLTPTSLTFVRPTGDALEWLQRYTAGPVPSFGVASFFGALLGAALAASSMGRFRLTTFSNAAETRRTLGGAMLMGVGGVLALGCTIGQAVTGISTLALGSFLTFGAILIGGMQGMKHLERVMLNEA